MLGGDGELCEGTVCGGPQSGLWPEGCLTIVPITLLNTGLRHCPMTPVHRLQLGLGLWSVGFLIHCNKVKRQNGKYFATCTECKALSSLLCKNLR